MREPSSAVAYLRSPRAIRERCRALLELGTAGRLKHFRVDMERRQVDLGLVEILESVRRDERPRGRVRSKAAPKTEKRRAQRPGRRERQARRKKRS